MIPQTPSYERSGLRYIDGEFPIEYPERYRRFLSLACYKIARNIQALYENKFNRVRICMSCYDETHPNLRPNFECKMEWHSIGGETEVRMECSRCNTTLLRRRRAFECLDCLEQILDNEHRIGTHYTSPVRDHFVSDEDY